MGSSPAFQFLGTQPASVTILGVEVAVDPTTIVATWSVSTSLGGAGVGRTGFPLPVPPIQNLVGLPLYVQALVLDAGGPQGLAASRGLRFAVAGAPSIFVGCSIARNDPFQLVEPLTGTILDTGMPPEVNNVTGAAPYVPGVPLANGWTAALSNDEREICIPTWPSTGCSLAAPQLVRLEALTGTLLGTAPLPPNSNGSSQNLYTAVYR